MVNPRAEHVKPETIILINNSFALRLQHYIIYVNDDMKKLGYISVVDIYSQIIHFTKCLKLDIYDIVKEFNFYAISLSAKTFSQMPRHLIKLFIYIYIANCNRLYYYNCVILPCIQDKCERVF